MAFPDDRASRLVGGAIVLGVSASSLSRPSIPITPASITSGPAVVDNAPQLNLRSCAAANCGVVTTLNKGDRSYRHKIL